MSVVSPVKYDVLEDILKKWLEEEFKGQAWCEPASDESGTGYWKVMAPREITPNEQHMLKKKGLKKRRTIQRD